MSTDTTLDPTSTRRRAMLDRLGISASLLCAIHCAAMPLAFTILPLAGAHVLLGGAFELVMIAISATVGIVSLGSSYRVHRQINPLLMMSAGATILVANFIGHDSHSHAAETLHPYIAVVAGLMIATAHRINMRLCSACQTCEIEHDHDRANG
ncbi:MAG TPA: MerC domain-containing protein [Candidatus Kapabacteria bacterium]|nr:MerC domain-containing protein [Candidatus Kapabacteria bacterium]